MSNAKIRTNKNAGGMAGKFVDWTDQLAFSWPTRQGFYRHLASQVANGISVDVAIDTFRVRLQRRKKPSSDKIVGDVARRMRDGATLAGALGGWIPADEVSLIHSGEISGNLPRSLNLLIDAKRRVSRVNSSLKAAMVNPAIYFIAVYGMIWTIGRFVIPNLQQALPIEQAHGLVYALYVAGNFANSYWILLPLCLLSLGIFIIVHSFSRWTGSNRIKAESFFPYSFYRDSQGYVWLMSFAALLRAGMVDTEILKSQLNGASPWMKERLQAVRWRMDNGASLPAALLAKGKSGLPALGFPNPDIVDDISSLAGFSDFPEKISVLATQWADELEQSVVDGTKKFGAAMEIFMYAVMGFLMVAINTMSEQMASVPGL